ncbi:MAG: energy-coupling factor ABC transporter permease [Actinobacteria bacterium]|nr:energy-coupling factor ABC transporter permease [Actinomycetota bacterium]MBU1943383.1 energy-coupling factor ABC transporter permease [Actinomycetota bacterium]MBU2686740.1 energy-coupling factor ABC transporter permease [Actinomycetota bacterium]
MHIPDGFLDGRTMGALWGVSGATTAYALYRVRETLDDAKKVPLIGVTAAFVFAAQMLNFPVAGGVSGHFVGALLACVLLGPWEGFLVMEVVLLVQCLLFSDGGLAALGANIFNMAILSGLLSYYLFALAKSLIARRGGEKAAILTSAGLFAWFSVVIASVACSFELAISGTLPLSTGLPTMVGVHSLIGIGEAFITVAVLAVVLQARPDLVSAYKSPGLSAGLPAGEVA